MNKEKWKLNRRGSGCHSYTLVINTPCLLASDHKDGCCWFCNLRTFPLLPLILSHLASWRSHVKAGLTILCPITAAFSLFPDSGPLVTMKRNRVSLSHGLRNVFRAHIYPLNLSLCQYQSDMTRTYQTFCRTWQRIDFPCLYSQDKQVLGSWVTQKTFQLSLCHEVGVIM